MQDLKTLKTQVLIDILVKETAQYTSKIAQKNNAELTHFEYEIALIQGELNARKMGRKNVSIRDHAIKLKTSAKSKKNKGDIH